MYIYFVDKSFIKQFLNQKMQSSPHYLTFEHLSKFSGIKHFVSTRIGGVSSLPYHSLNVGLSTEDAIENVLSNRQILADSIGIPLENFCFARQVHEANVLKLTHTDKGRGSQTLTTALPACDAMISNEKGVCPAVMAADCVPILLYDSTQNAIGAVHSGWRGTVKKILGHTLRAMQNHFGTNPADVWAGIGACIRVENYEVGQEVVEVIRQNFGTEEGYLQKNPQTHSKHFDLVYANRKMLIDAGVPQTQIEVMPFCTYTRGDLFFSARRGGQKSGRFCAGICLV